MTERSNDILDVDKVKEAISHVLKTFDDDGLTVAEQIHVLKSLEAGYKSEFPKVYEIMAGNGGK